MRKREKPIAVFKGGTFSEEMRNYGKDKMKRDPQYQRDVFEALKARNRDKKAVEP